MMVTGLRNMTASPEWLGAIAAFCPSVASLARRVHAGSELSCFRNVSWRALGRHRDEAVKTRLATAALLGRGFGGHPASRSKRMQILRSAVREAGWLAEP